MKKKGLNKSKIVKQLMRAVEEYQGIRRIIEVARLMKDNLRYFPSLGTTGKNQVNQVAELSVDDNWSAIMATRAIGKMELAIQADLGCAISISNDSTRRGFSRQLSEAQRGDRVGYYQAIGSRKETVDYFASARKKRR